MVLLHCAFADPSLGEFCSKKNIIMPLLEILFVFHYISEKVSFIDFEYVGYNYQAFEIGNHFCEYAGQHFAISIFVKFI